jgi:hypothetical protein
METNFLFILPRPNQYVLIYDIDKDSILLNQQIESNHSLFGIPIKDCKVGDLYHLKITNLPGTMEYCVRPANIPESKNLITNSRFKTLLLNWKTHYYDEGAKIQIHQILTQIEKNYIIECREQKLNQIL